jgi:hypothetical protein
VPTLVSRAASASDDESMISFEGNDDGKESNDDDDDEESVIIPNPSDAIADSDYIPPHNDFSPVWDSIQSPGQMGYGYEDFAFFCENTDPTVINWVDNNQLYFWQKCLTKKEDSNNESGGWRGLCHRAIKKQQFDRSGMVDVEMSKLLFHQMMYYSTKHQKFARARSCHWLIICVLKCKTVQIKSFENIMKPSLLEAYHELTKKQELMVETVVSY